VLLGDRKNQPHCKCQ